MSCGFALILTLAQAIAVEPSPAAGSSLERTIAVEQAGRVAVRLDRDVYEGARPDLSDLRVLDDSGGLVPFVLDPGRPPARPRDVEARIRNQGWQEDGAASAVLDFGERLRKTRLRLSLSGDNFRRRVSVEASDDGERWASIVDEAWVFAVPSVASARYETVVLPENDFPLLRVTVHPGEGERSRVRVDAAAIPSLAAGNAHEQALRPAWTRAEDARSHETWLTLDLGARHQPFHAVELEIADPRFFREARLEARRDPLPGRGQQWWDDLGGGAVHRLEHAGKLGECLRLEATGRERVLRVRLRNGDDRPLDVRGVTVRVPVERVAFEAAAGRSYRLVYGAASARAPSFDLARTVDDPLAWAAAAAEVSIGSAQRRSGAATSLPWTERHPALLWTGLLAVVVSLGLLTWRALRQVGG